MLDTHDMNGMGGFEQSIAIDIPIAFPLYSEYKG